MASIRKSIFAKMFYTTVVFFLECRGHSDIATFLLQLYVKLFVRPAQMQIDNLVFFLTIEREELLDNNVPFWGLYLAVKDTRSELCGKTLIK